MEKKNKIVLSVIVFFIALLCIFYISNRKPKFDKNKWDKVSHRFEMSDDLIQILEKKRLNKKQDINSAGQACRIPGLNFQSEFPVYAEKSSCAILIL